MPREVLTEPNVKTKKINIKRKLLKDCLPVQICSKVMFHFFIVM